jgi:hypothetical protein
MGRVRPHGGIVASCGREAQANSGWDYKGLSTGDVVNDLSALVGDPNVTIHEAKAFDCQVTRG